MPTRAGNRTRMSPAWVPSADDIAFSDKHGIGEVQPVAEAFRDYHLAQGSLMADWPAAWRTWCRNAVKFDRRRRRPANAPLLVAAGPPDPADPYGAFTWAERVPGTAQERVNGQVVPCINGFDAAATAIAVCEAAGLAPEWRGDLMHVALWLRDGLEPDHIVSIIRGSRPPHEPGSWWWYDKKMRL